MSCEHTYEGGTPYEGDITMNVKRNWKVLNELLNKNKSNLSSDFVINGISTSDPGVICDEFCRHFTEHPIDVQTSLPLSLHSYMDLIPFNGQTMGFFYTDEHEIINATKTLKKSGSLKDISAKLLKLSIPRLSPFLVKLFNLCIDRGEFPNLLKVSKIQPVHKKGSKSVIENYRPISILTNLSKIFETLIQKRLESFFRSSDLLSENQFGFREGRNTEMAALKLIEKLMPALSYKKFGICVFIDFKACFDTVSRELLFDKLYRYGLRGVSLNFIVFF